MSFQHFSEFISPVSPGALEGSSTLSNAELTTAYYLIQGYSQNEIAGIRNVHPDSVKEYVRSLKKRTGAKDLDEALKIAAPIVEEYKDQLVLDRRRGRHFTEVFTAKQIQVLEYTAQGLKLREIGEKMGIQAVSVSHNRRIIYQKLGVHTAKDAVKAARERGLIPGANEWSDKPTPEQLAVLRELAVGGTQEEIAERIGVSRTAVKARLKRMFAKLGVYRADELVMLAVERDWLLPGQ